MSTVGPLVSGNYSDEKELFDRIIQQRNKIQESYGYPPGSPPPTTEEIEDAADGAGEIDWFTVNKDFSG